MIRAAAFAALALAPAVLAPAARAGTAVPWSVTEFDAPAAEALAVSPGGRLLLARAVCGAAGCATAFSTRAAGSPLAEAATVPGRATGSVAQRTGGALVLTTPLTQRGLVAVDVSATGTVRRSRMLTRRFARDASAASNGSGASAVIWLTSRLPQRLQVRTRTRDGAAFGPARTLARFGREGGFGGGSVAVGPRGEIAVLWAAHGALRARVQPPGGPGFGPVLRAGPSDRRAQVAPAFTEGGTLVAAWRSADGGAEQSRVAVVRVASLRPGARRFDRGRRLGEGADAETLALGRGVGLRAFAAGRTANVAWTSRSLQVRLATVHADGAVTAVRVLDPRAVLVDAAGSAAGRALVAWTHDPLGQEPAARAMLRLTPRRLGPIEPIGPGVARATGVALDPAATRALVTWGAADPLLSPRWGVAERPLP